MVKVRIRRTVPATLSLNTVCAAISPDNGKTLKARLRKLF
jgi:hypothetical protein